MSVLEQKESLRTAVGGFRPKNYDTDIHRYRDLQYAAPHTDRIYGSLFNIVPNCLWIAFRLLVRPKPTGNNRAQTPVAIREYCLFATIAGRVRRMCRKDEIQTHNLQQWVLTLYSVELLSLPR